MDPIKIILQNIEQQSKEKESISIENNIINYKAKLKDNIYDSVYHAKKLYKLLTSFNNKVATIAKNSTVNTKTFEQIGKYLYFYIKATQTKKQTDDEENEEIDIRFEPEIPIDNTLDTLITVWRDYYATTANEPANRMSIDKFIEKINECISYLGLQDQVKYKIIECGAESKFQAIYAVGKASTHNRPRMLVVELGSGPYIFASVGKGVIYDSGGLSLKPSKYMENMHKDMLGGALAIFSSLLSYKQSRIPHICVIPLVENCIGPSAYRVGDIIETYSGKRIEVINTDAEGRVILADAVAYISKQKEFKTIKIVFTMATLTGALEVVFGKEYAAMLGTSRAVKNLIIKIKDEYGEYIGELPSDEIFRKALDSDKPNTNIRNSSREYGGGVITAYKFIEEFHTPEKVLIHFDVANFIDRNLLDGNSATNLLEVMTAIFTRAVELTTAQD